MVTIRNFQEKDREAVREICIKTAPEAAVKTEIGRNYILTMYCDYYIDCCPEYCFVAADENDRAVGYILCAPSYEAYSRDFRKYVKRVFSFSFTRGISAFFESKISGRFLPDFPAHMHIDILDGYQRMGVGTSLVNNLREKLISENIPGVMLVVGAGNKKGRCFYNKYGFKQIRNLGSGIAMGLKVN